VQGPSQQIPSTQCVLEHSPSVLQDDPSLRALEPPEPFEPPEPLAPPGPLAPPEPLDAEEGSTLGVPPVAIDASAALFGGSTPSAVAPVLLDATVPPTSPLERLPPAPPLPATGLSTAPSSPVVEPLVESEELFESLVSDCLCESPLDSNASVEAASGVDLAGREGVAE
jgi:hypothetical protein